MRVAGDSAVGGGGGRPRVGDSVICLSSGAVALLRLAKTHGWTNRNMAGTESG
jgi:hypothetical protein